MSLIEKIDAEIEGCRDLYPRCEGEREVRIRSYLVMLDWFKVLLLSEQKDVTDTNEGKIITIGDKIRESNESLADEINNLINKCHICSYQYNPRECHKNPCSTGILDYLNQPYTETN